jgi:hypothetical protein
MEKAMILDLINGVIADSTMKLAIERVLEISPLLLLIIFELFSKLFIMKMKIA